MFIPIVLSDALKWKINYLVARKLISLKKIEIFILIVLFSCTTVFAENGKELLMTLFHQSKSKVQYTAPSMDNFRKAKNLFHQMLTQPMKKPDMETRWSELGYELHEIILNDETLWVLSPDEIYSKSNGFFVFRDKSSIPVVIQAPHRYFDFHTGQIAMKLFRENRIKACAWNTVHRRNVDFGKEENSFFHALTLAAADCKHDISILQLHGYGAKREGEPLVDDVILSNGIYNPSGELYEISQCLSKSQSIRVAVFPIDVNQLGGTRNIASKAFKERNSDNFFHIEMSKAFRERLSNKHYLRDDFLKCFINRN